MAFFQYQNHSLYYSECGQGSPVIFLHGNTASSKLFEPLMPLYSGQFRCILLDFLGNGRSDRVADLPLDLWQEQGRQTIALAQHLRCGKVGLIGTSGGAWAALNAALERPDLFYAVVADSFDGRTLHDSFAQDLAAERQFAKSNAASRQFYEWCQGEDWEQVVDLDTSALLRLCRKQRPLLCKPLSQLAVPLLLTGSLTDTMCRIDMEQEYAEMASLTGASVHLFAQGEHPSLLSNAEQIAQVISEFLCRHITVKGGCCDDKNKTT